MTNKNKPTRLEFRISRKAKQAFAKYAKKQGISMGKILKNHIDKVISNG